MPANCYSANPVTMTLTIPGSGSAYDFAPNFPEFSRAGEPQRPDHQGPSYTRVNIVLTGFFVGETHNEIMAQYNALLTFLDNNNLIFNYTDGATKIEDNRRVYANGINIPTDWHQYEGDFTVNLYYFKDVTQSSDAQAEQFTASYNGFTFPKLPAWKRGIKHNRESFRGPVTGRTAVISLNGILFYDTHALLVTAINALNTACATDGTLTYGNFAQSVKIVEFDVGPAVLEQWAPYSVQLTYDLDDVAEIKSDRSSSRLHYNPVIKEKPYCNTRTIRLMNLSGQEVSYNVSVTAKDIATAKSQAATEIANIMIAGGIELPGGTQGENDRTGTFHINCRKFYNTAVIANLLNS